MTSIRCGIAALTMGAFLAFLPAAAGAAFTPTELKCSQALAKNYAKLQSSLLKINAKCHKNDIAAKTDSPDGCDTLSVKEEAKAEKARDKFVAKVAKSCSSVCSISNEVPCIDNLRCPPLLTGGPSPAAESCAGKGGAKPLQLRNLDWPGPYCVGVLGHSLRNPEDLGECLAELSSGLVEAIDQAVFADLDEGSGLDKDELKCVTKASKAVGKALQKAYLATADCRDTRRSAGDPDAYACSTEDPDVVADIQKWIGKLDDTIAKSCTDTTVAALTGLCAAGGSSPSTVADAQACLGDLVRELATEERGHNRHIYAAIGMLNVTHPNSAQAYCGDGVVTPDRDESTGVGEECDGDDAPCGGGTCLPPGDVFECTCDSTPRERFIVSSENADSDAGWNGASHDAIHNDGFGYVSELSNCDCTAFSGATCTGSTTDQVCDVFANMAPRCTDDLSAGALSCDARGNGDGTGSDADCFTCDDDSINAGTWCANGQQANEHACQSQCFVTETDLPVDPQKACDSQADCGAGETCRGRCDNSIRCHEMTEGTPLPLIAAAIPVCIMLKYKTDIVGTKDIVTGEQTVNYTTRSLVQLGEIAAEPCPVCSGICVGGSLHGEACFGTCDVTGDPCLEDADCTDLSDTTCEESAANCPGGSCSLSLRCSDGLNIGRLCRPDSTTVLGIVSHDCPPTPNAGLSGTGVQQPFGDVTTGAVQFPVGGPCTDPAWVNYDCPCPADTPPNFGVPTKPSSCAAACDGGVNAGKGCVTGGGGTGVFTVCVGGTDAGKNCDEDIDCEGGGTCSGNPRHCTAGPPVEIGTACSVNADCGGGGLCEDPCPGARCVPLCLQEGVCNGGARDGDFCSTTDHCKQCTAGNPSLIATACVSSAQCDTTSASGDGVCSVLGGVTCDITDVEDGLCAAGPIKYRCNGEGLETVPCELNYGTCESNLCTGGSPAKRGLACSANVDCLDTPNVPVSSGCETGVDSLPGTSDDVPGAGECEPRPEDCYVNNGYAEGGSTLNPPGSPSDVRVNATFCTPANSNTGVNQTSGFGGPSRIRRQGTAIVNVPSIP